jgi:cell division protein FtsB
MTNPMAEPSSADGCLSNPVQTPRQVSHRSHAIESAIMLGVNFLLGGIAIAGLAQVVPQSLSDHAKVQSLEAELKQTKQRVNDLQATYKLNSDPKQFQRIAQEEGNLIAANQRRIVWLKPVQSANDKPKI